MSRTDIRRGQVREKGMDGWVEEGVEAFEEDRGFGLFEEFVTEERGSLNGV